MPQRDYYRLVAAFSSTRRVERYLDASAGAEYGRSKQQHHEALAELRTRFDRWRSERRQALREQKIAALPLGPDEKALLRQPADKKNADQAELLKKFAPQLNIRDDALLKSLPEAEQAEWAAQAKAIEALQATAPREPPKALSLDGGDNPRVLFLERGDPEREKPEGYPGFLTALTKDVNAWEEKTWTRWLPREDPGAGSPRQPVAAPRLALAEWITETRDGAGALAARVLVNRIWQHHFGEGLVRTPNDFGAQGARPTHPELLDWLASELIRGGWRLKALHRTILLSAAYRQDTAFDPAKVKIDPDNRLLWRRVPARLTAEAIRDSLLAVSGCLNRQMDGPSIHPWIHPDAIFHSDGQGYVGWPKTVTQDGPTTWRRSLYVCTKRSNPVPMLQVFDSPDALAGCGRRNSTTVAPQALALLNDRFVREQARYFAGRVGDQAGTEPEARARAAFGLALGRAPTERELDAAVRFLEQQAGRYATNGATQALLDLCHGLFCVNEFIYID